MPRPEWPMLQLVAGRTSPNARVSQQPSSQSQYQGSGHGETCVPQSILKSGAITGYEVGPGRHAEHRMEDSHNGNAHCPQRNKDPAAVAATANTRPTGCPGRLARMTAAAAGQRGGQTGSCPSLSPPCCVAVTWPRAAGALQCFPRSLRRRPTLQEETCGGP
jgi:hypothetical protein